MQMIQNSQQVLGFDDQDIGILQEDGLRPVSEPVPGGGQGRRVQIPPGQVGLKVGKSQNAPGFPHFPDAGHRGVHHVDVVQQMSYWPPGKF